VVLVIQGGAAPDSTVPEDQADIESDLRLRLASLREDGIRAKDAVAQVAETTGLAKNRVYQVWVELGREAK